MPTEQLEEDDRVRPGKRFGIGQFPKAEKIPVPEDLPTPSGMPRPAGDFHLV